VKHRAFRGAGGDRREAACRLSVVAAQSTEAWARRPTRRPIADIPPGQHHCQDGRRERDHEDPVETAPFATPRRFAQKPIRPPSRRKIARASSAARPSTIAMARTTTTTSSSAATISSLSRRQLRDFFLPKSAWTT